MGISSFYRWLVNKYPKIVVNAKEEKAGEGVVIDTTQPNPNGMEFDNLYIDMNRIIHPCFHGDNNIFPPTTCDEVFNGIFEQIDRLFTIVRPRKLLYMAIDGVAPIAKMSQQRRRRFLDAKLEQHAEAEEEKLRREFELLGKRVLPKREFEVSDSNVVLPGTEFMDKLSKALKKYVLLKLKNDPGWQDIKVILSDANAPGEGEHKIMEFIRLQRNRDGYNPNTRHCVYSTDADLILLALATHEVHFSILREDVSVQQPSRTLLLEASLSRQNVYAVRSRPWLTSTVRTPYQFLNIWTLREYLELDMRIPDSPKDFMINVERIIDDFIFMCFFAGNDILPRLPTLEIHEGAIDLLMAVYKSEFKSIGGYLVDTCQLKDEHCAYIKFERVEKLILAVGCHEDQIFKKRSQLQKWKLDRILHEKLEAMDDDVTNEVVLKNTMELKQKLKESLQQKLNFFNNGTLLTDKVRLGSEGWKARYYSFKFSLERPEETEIMRRELVQNYAEGLCWVLQYYFEGVCSWSWYYKYHYGPFASDFRGLSGCQVKFHLGMPFKPLSQLMAVLPPRSAHALPEAYRSLMTCSDSNIIDLYPTDFVVDLNGKHNMGQGVTLLEFIDEKRLLHEIEKLESKLKEDEVRRNAVSLDMIFVRASHDFGSQVSYFCCHCVDASKDLQSLNEVTINWQKSGGLNGFLRSCHDYSSIDTSISTMTGTTSFLKNDVICAFFKNPRFQHHIPKPSQDVEIPEKTVTENDIEETPLWHKHNGSKRRVNRLQYQQRHTRVAGNGETSKSSELKTYEKGAGSGGGSERGRESIQISNFCWNSEKITSKFLQAGNGGFAQPQNGLRANGIGKWKCESPRDILSPQGRGRSNIPLGNGLQAHQSGSWNFSSSCDISYPQVGGRGNLAWRNFGSESMGRPPRSKNGSRADRSDNWESNAEPSAALTNAWRRRWRRLY